MNILMIKNIEHEILYLIGRYCKFDNDQTPVSNWHDKQDLLEAVRKALHIHDVSCTDLPKYTESQVREAIEMAREPEYWDSGSYWGNLYSPDEIIEELNKGD